eukprot:gb/GFBE01040989.1/.p1 GENE.gb/GFBE01040989.1/~~gb/GFBE01040989.1/.p1  ORF type:complete len:399 (+),score=50.53 gb/GFBE01040989.1/:1-1197(+)
MESSIPSGRRPVSWVKYIAALLIGWTVLLIGLFEHAMAITKLQHRSELDKLHSMFSQLNATMQSSYAESNRHGALRASQSRVVEPAKAERRAERRAGPGVGSSKPGVGRVGSGLPPVPALKLVDRPAPERRLKVYDSAVVGSATVATGCIQLADHATSNSLTMSSATCTGSHRCPPCFIATGLSQDSTLEIVACSTAKLTSTVSLGSAQIQDYTFVNADADNVLTIKSVTTASGSAVTTHYLPPLTSVVAQCYGGSSNAMSFADKWASYGPVDFCPTGCGVQVPVTEDTTASGTAATYRGVDSAASTVVTSVTATSSINGCTAISLGTTEAACTNPITASCTTANACVTLASCATPMCTDVTESCAATPTMVSSSSGLSTTCATAFYDALTITTAAVR